MALGTRTLDLTDRVVELNDRLAEIRNEKRRLQDEIAEEVAASNDVDEPEELPDWDEYEQEWNELDAEQTEKKGERRKFIETVVEWETDGDVSEIRRQTDSSDEYREELEEYYGDVDSSIVEVRELTFGQLQRVSDDMMDESFDVDMEKQDFEGTPKQGFYQIELLREAIVGWPDGAPEREEFGTSKPDPAEYPIPVGDWLFEKVDAINTTGDTDMGNSSLSEAMRSDR